MANIFLALVLVAAAFAWRHTGFWLPPFLPLGGSSRSRILLLGGWLIVGVTVGFSSGDILGGRTQISKDPVRYASRLHGPDAHEHDLPDAPRFWQQVLLQCGVGVVVGASLVAASRVRRSDPPVGA